jgi:IclR family transcriptional regulator, KDG regulon repressor
MLGTLRRAGDVLDLFTVEEPEWGVTATARQLGIGKSLAHDVLASLAAIGLVQRVGHGRYRLGWRNMSLASVLLRTSELRLHATPVLRQLVERQGATASLVAWDRGRIIYIDHRHSQTHAGPRGPVAGTIVSIDGGAASKVLLASRPSGEIRSLWDEGSLPTKYASFAELETDLERVRQHGWAGSEGGPTPAGRAVAAPVRDAEGDVVAAVTLSLCEPGRIPDTHRQAHLAVAAATRITQAIRQCAVH